MFFFKRQATLYIKLSPERLTIRNLKTGEQFSEVPELAILQEGSKRVVIGFGAGARQAAADAGQKHGPDKVEVIKPFAHPRSLVSDFTCGEILLKTVVKMARGTRPFSLAPRIVLHPLGSPLGGFTQIERRAFQELALGAGASDVVLWIGHELSDQEALSAQLLKNAEKHQ